MSCGELGPIEGGLVKDSTIQDSTITGSEFIGGAVKSSDLEGCSLKGLVSVDEASAGVIASAIAGAGSVTQGTPEAMASGSELPTGVYGSRDALLGQPAAWIEIGGFVVPAFRKASNG